MMDDNQFGSEENSFQGDAELARGIARHDQNAIARLFSEYQGAVTRYVYHTIPGISEADLLDVTQDTFMAVLQSIKDYRAESSLSTWILRIAYFKAIDALRKKKTLDKREASFTDFSKDEIEIDYVDPAGTIDEGLISGEEMLKVRKALAQLPDVQRQVLTFRYVMGLRVEKIAETMNISRRMVELHITRGRSSLRNLLAEK